MFGGVTGRPDRSEAVLQPRCDRFAGCGNAAPEGGGQFEPPHLCRLHDCNPERMAGAALDGRRDGKDGVLITIDRHNVRHLGVATRQRSRLVEGNGYDLAKCFQRRAALDQQSLTRTGGKTRSNSRRCGNHERAGTSNQQRRETPIHPCHPVTAEGERRHDNDQSRDDHRARRVPAAETVDHTRRRGL